MARAGGLTFQGSTGLLWKILKNLTPRNAFSCILERKLSFSYHSSFTHFTTKNLILLSKNLFIQSSTVQLALKNVCNALFWVRSIVKRILFGVWNFFWETCHMCIANWVTPFSYFLQTEPTLTTTHQGASLTSYK